MMIKHILSHQWKKSKRSTIWHKNLVINIVIGFFMSILVLEFLAFAILLPEILGDSESSIPADLIVDGAIIYFFFAVFVLRFMAQPLPTMDMDKYLHLPISKKKLANLMVVKSMFNFISIITLIAFMPFTLRFMIPEFGLVSGLAWFVAILVIDLNINFLAMYLKRLFNGKQYVAIIIIVVLASIVGLEKLGWISIFNISQKTFDAITQNPVLSLITLVFIPLTYFLNYGLIRKFSYTDDIKKKVGENERISQSLSGLESKGKLGVLILNEIRLLLRNKRAKTTLMLIPLFLGYGLFFYPNEVYQNSNFFLAFVGIFVSGGFLMSYGQYTLAWESRHFDLLMTSNFSVHEFFKAKYLLMVFPSILLFVFTIPYVYFGYNILLINFIALVYNVGVNTTILLFAASYNKKRMELDKGGSMNYQGLGLNNFIIVLPLLFLPAVFYALTSFIFNSDVALAVLAILGVIGIAGRNYFIKEAVKFFLSRKYIITEGFRSKN